MFAYSFKKHFAAPILAGTKAQTTHADRKRHVVWKKTWAIASPERRRHG